MKKLLLIGSVFVLSFVISGCDLANEDDAYYESIKDAKKEKLEESDYFIPSRIDFKIYRELYFEKVENVSEYFFVDFNCRNMSVWDNCFGTNYGKSMSSSVTKVGANSQDESEFDEHITKIDFTFYALKQNELVIYPTFILENKFGEIKEEHQIGTVFATGATIDGKITSMKDDNTVFILDYTFHYVTIDRLKLVTIKQFDKDDNLIEETIVEQDNLIESLVLNSKTQYYFIIEDYIDSDGIEYQERIYNDSQDYFYYLYKYTNNKGFLDGNTLAIKSN